MRENGGVADLKGIDRFDDGGRTPPLSTGNLVYQNYEKKRVKRSSWTRPAGYKKHVFVNLRRVGKKIDFFFFTFFYH